MKIKVFHAKASQKPPSLGAMTHVGSLKAALHRLESIRANQVETRYMGKEVLVQDKKSGSVEMISAEEALKRTGSFLGRGRIYECHFEVERPIRLKDCWGDDPIGSGGMGLFSDTISSLSAEQRKGLSDIFKLFSGIVFPREIDLAVKQKKIDIRSWEDRLKKSPLFTKELKKREEKLGEEYKKDHPYEVVWSALTMDLRRWALKERYDSFVYRNDSEGDGEESYVALKDGQISQEKVLRFDSDAFLRDIPVLIEKLHRHWAEREKNGRQPFFSETSLSGYFLS